MTGLQPPSDEDKPCEASTYRIASRRALAAS
jgi:hypothetical protein